MRVLAVLISPQRINIYLHLFVPKRGEWEFPVLTDHNVTYKPGSVEFTLCAKIISPIHKLVLHVCAKTRHLL